MHASMSSEGRDQRRHVYQEGDHKASPDIFMQSDESHNKPACPSVNRGDFKVCSGSHKPGAMALHTGDNKLATRTMRSAATRRLAASPSAKLSIEGAVPCSVTLTSSGCPLASESAADQCPLSDRRFCCIDHSVNECSVEHFHLEWAAWLASYHCPCTYRQVQFNTRNRQRDGCFCILQRRQMVMQ